MISDPLVIVLIAIVVVFGGIMWLRLEAFVALLLGAFVVALLTPSAAIEQYGLSSGMTPQAAANLANQTAGARIGTAFGNTAASIGILIAMAAIIGRCLLESGAAERIVRSILTVTGEKKAPGAYAASSFFLGIPVFFDTVFYLMIPLAKALAARTGRNYLLLVMAIAAGASMAHSLVPPTPGPLFLVSELQIPIHMMVIGGLIVGTFTVSSGFLYAKWANKRFPVPLRGSADAPLREIEALVEKDTSELPSFWFSILPIIIPVVFITAAGVMNIGPDSGFLLSVVRFLGEKNAALVTGAVISLLLLAKYRRGDQKGISESVQGALTSGGMIILITSAGGAFGAMLQQTGVSERIASLTEGYQVALIPLAWLVTAIVRTAQGSATVSMITAAGIVGGLASAGLPFHVLYIGLAIACGSKLFTWMNDSGFWIVSKMSNMTEQETLKSFSMMQLVMGVVGLIVCMIGAMLFPLV